MTYPAIKTISSRDCMNIAEYRFHGEDFRQITNILLNETGIFLSEEKMPLVYSRLVKRLNLLNVQSFSDYCAYIESDAGQLERDRMLNALTTNVTRFFRESHHFETLKTKVLPRLISHAINGGQVRLWSAACSSGEEPYSMAMSILDLLPNAASYDIRILASDVDGDIIKKAKMGIYQQEDIEPVSERQRKKYFTLDNAKSSTWKVRDELQQLICFKQLNLVKPWPVAAKFDIIFCRNVVIYFQSQTQNELWARFHRAMSSDGWLFIGHSEHVTGPASAAFQCDGSTTYRRLRKQNKLFL